LSEPIKRVCSTLGSSVSVEPTWNSRGYKVERSCGTAAAGQAGRPGRFGQLGRSGRPAGHDSARVHTRSNSTGLPSTPQQQRDQPHTHRFGWIAGLIGLIWTLGDFRPETRGRRRADSSLSFRGGLGLEIGERCGRRLSLGRHQRALRRLSRLCRRSRRWRNGGC
jgi:hypothetical protein